jgi:hypothetical protein
MRKAWIEARPNGWAAKARHPGLDDDQPEVGLPLHDQARPGTGMQAPSPAVGRGRASP